MLETKLIICPVDFSEFSVRAYRHALSLAEHYRAKLVALHVVELWRYPYADYAASAGDYAEFCRVLQEGGKEQLREFAKKHTDNQIEPELAVHQGMAADSILSFVQSPKADLIVMGTHGRRGFDRLVLGSVTDRVMRKAPCPVLAVSGPSSETMAGKEPHHAHHLNHVLFCTDFSENSRAALSYAISAAEEYHAELTLLHVLEQVSSGAGAEDAVAQVMRHLDELVPPERRKTLEIKTEVRTGKPYQQIIQLALEAQTDLVVMGVRGGGSLDAAVFGSTTYRVIQLGSCPVLTVHA